MQSASLYSYVKNFDELKIGIMNYGWKQLERQMLQDVAGVSGYDAIRVMCRAFYNYAVCNPGIFEVMLVNNSAFGNPVSIEESFEISVDILIAGIQKYEE